jgi:hypothetical protein
VGQLDALCLLDQFEHPDRLIAVKYVQDGAFQPGGLDQLGQHAGRYRAVAERAPVGVPPGNGCMQGTLLRLRLVRRGQPDRREHQRLAGIGQQ